MSSMKQTIALLLVSSCLAQIAIFNPRSQPKEIDVNYVNECCVVHNNPKTLYKCVTAAADQVLIDGWYDASNIKIAIVSYASSSITDYAAYAFGINQAYAEHNRYIFHIADPIRNNFEPGDARWNKVKLLEQSLLTWAQDSDYIIWVDADLIFLDFSMKIEQIVSSPTYGEIWVSASMEDSTIHNVMNSGMIILKNSNFIRSWFLPTWWNYANRLDFNDQEVFDQIYMKYKQSHELETKIVILDPDALNSNPPAAVNQKSKNQIMHLMGDHLRVRQYAFKAGFLEVCRVTTIQSHSQSSSQQSQSLTASIGTHTEIAADATSTAAHQSLKHQLGLDQKTLLAIALREYRAEADLLMTAFRSRMSGGTSGSDTSKSGGSDGTGSRSPTSDSSDTTPTSHTSQPPHDNVAAAVAAHAGYNDFPQVTELNSAVRRYCEGLDFIEKHWPTHEIVLLRQGKWSLLDQHLDKTNSSLLQLFDDAENVVLNNKKLKRAYRKGVLRKHPDTADSLRETLHTLFRENLQAHERIKTNILPPSSLPTSSSSSSSAAAAAAAAAPLVTAAPVTLTAVTAVSEEVQYDRQERAMLVYVVLESASPVIKRRTLRIMTELKQQQEQKHHPSISITSSSSQSSPSSALSKTHKKEIEKSFELMGVILTYADELLTLELPAKSGYVHHIRSDLFVDIHMLFKLHNQQPDLSFNYLEKAVEEKEKEALLSGDQCLPKVLMMMGDALCHKKRYTESLPYFNRAIAIVKAYWGSTQANLAHFSYLSGQAHAAAGQYQAAIELFQSSLYIHGLHPDTEADTRQDRQRAQALIDYCSDKVMSQSESASATAAATATTTTATAGVTHRQQRSEL